MSRLQLYLYFCSFVVVRQFPVIVSKQAEELVSKFFPQKIEELQQLLKVFQLLFLTLAG